MNLPIFQRSGHPAASLLRHWAVELLHVQPTDHVLELGLGAGRALQDAATQLGSGYVVRIDPANPMVQPARGRNAPAVGPDKVHFVQGVGEALPFAAGTFDRALVIDVIHALADPVVLLREVQRVLRPGGQVAVLWMKATARLRPGQAIVQGNRQYETVEVVELLLAAGFDGPWMRTSYFAWGEGLCAQATKPGDRSSPVTAG